MASDCQAITGFATRLHSGKALVSGPPPGSKARCDIASASRYVPIKDSATNPTQLALAVRAVRQRTESQTPRAAANATNDAAASASGKTATSGVPLITPTNRRPPTDASSQRTRQTAPINLARRISRRPPGIMNRSVSVFFCRSRGTAPATPSPIAVAAVSRTTGVAYVVTQPAGNVPIPRITTTVMLKTIVTLVVTTVVATTSDSPLT